VIEDRPPPAGWGDLVDDLTPDLTVWNHRQVEVEVQLPRLELLQLGRSDGEDLGGDPPCRRRGTPVNGKEIAAVTPGPAGPWMREAVALQTRPRPALLVGSNRDINGVRDPILLGVPQRRGHFSPAFTPVDGCHGRPTKAYCVRSGSGLLGRILSPSE